MTKEIIKETMIDDSVRYGYYTGKIFIYHREEKDGPAIIYGDGSTEWFNNGRMHRERGPAFADSVGTIEWWINDKEITHQVEGWLNERNIKNYKDMTEEDKFALTFFMRSL